MNKLVKAVNYILDSYLDVDIATILKFNQENIDEIEELSAQLVAANQAEADTFNVQILESRTQQQIG